VSDPKPSRFSVGDVVSIATSLLLAGVVWGASSQRLSAIEDEQRDMRAKVDLVPVLAQRQDEAERRAAENRTEIKEALREIREDVRAIRANVDNHESTAPRRRP
jgi:uncharacterized protein involved in exopolysaccharide biosynthesis